MEEADDVVFRCWKSSMVIAIACMFSMAVLLFPSAAVSQSLDGAVYEGTLDPAYPYVAPIAVRITFQTGNRLLWEMGDWGYWDDEDDYTYTFPPIDKVTDYAYSHPILEFEVEWTGDIATYEDSQYRCRRASFRNSAGGFTVSPDGKTIAGNFLYGGRFCYGSSCWTDSLQEAGSLSLTRKETDPTSTPTPTATNTPQPTPLGFDEEDLLLFIQSWHQTSVDSPYEVSGDNYIDASDLMILGLNWTTGQ